MKLRKPCPHGFYDKHVTLLDPEVGPVSRCDGGVFLPDDTLVIERLEDRELYRGVKRFISDWHNASKVGWGPDHSSYDEMGQ